MTSLITKRLTLSRCSPDDRADFMDLERDPEVMRFLNGGYAIDHDTYLPDGTFLMPRGTEAFVWTARHTGSGAFAGWFCLWPEGDQIAELGYRLRRTDWGKGLASEGAAALIDWGFENGLYDKIFASTMTVNQASRRVMEKAGLHHVHTIHPDWALPISGSEHGEVVYETTRTAWIERKA